MNGRQHLPPEGRDCLLTPSHGPSLVIGRKNAEWCPHSDHSKAKPPEPSLLSAQQAQIDAARSESDGA